MKKNRWAFVGSLVVFLVLGNTIARVLSGVVFGLTLGSGELTNTLVAVVTRLLVIALFLILNKAYYGISVKFKGIGKKKNWFYLLFVVIVLIGDATLSTGFSLSPLNIMTALLLGFSVGFLEEYVFRGLLIEGLKRDGRMPIYGIILTSGISFGAIHLLNFTGDNMLNTLLQAVSAVSIGCFLAAVYLLTSCLWIPIIFHGVIDAFDQIAFGTMDNSTGFGVITSVIYTIVFAALSAFLYIWFLKRKERKADPAEKEVAKYTMPKKKDSVNPVKSIIAICIPILELVIGGLVAPKIDSNTVKVLFTVGLFAIGLIVLLILYGNVLKSDWKGFRTHIFRNLGLAVLGMIVAYVLLSITRTLLGGSGGSDAALSAALPGTKASLITLAGSITALMAPFAEEIVFRHVLFYQWRGRKVITALMFILSSITFGLIHWNNFNGDVIQMIPYMIVGAWFALIYFWSKNIWQNIFTHLLFNSLQFFAALAMVVVSLVS